MVCVTVDDFLKAGGQPEFTAWGGEDDEFKERVRNLKLEIVREYDHGLLHLHHFNNCTKDVKLVKELDQKQRKVFKNCQSVQRIADE